MLNPKRFAAAAFIAAFAVFGGLWTLLEPIGGFAALNEGVSRDTINYAALVLISGTAGIAVAALRRPAPSQAVSVGASRRQLDFVSLIGRAERRVLIIGISLPTFTSEAGLRAIAELLHRGVHVDMVIVNPCSPAILQRPAELYQSYTSPAPAAASSLRAALRFRLGLAAADRDRFRFHLTNTLPTCAVVMIDDSCYWHPYLRKYTGVNSPYVRESCHGDFGQFIAAHAEGVVDVESFEPDDSDWNILLQRAKDDPAVRGAWRHERSRTR